METQTPQTMRFHRNLLRLNAMKSWTVNWDGEGGAAPDVLVLDAAAELLRLLHDQFPEICFSVDMDADSHPTLSLRQPGCTGFIVLETRIPDTGILLSFALEAGFGEVDDYAVPFMQGQGIPTSLYSALSMMSAYRAEPSADLIEPSPPL